MNKILINDGLGDIKLEQIDPDHWRTIEKFSYHADDGTDIYIPAGFVTDGTSSPFRVLIETWGGHYSTAALVHDWLYTAIVKDAESRTWADGILFEIMKKCGVHLLVRWGIWIAVRGFGGPLLRVIGVRNELGSTGGGN